MKVLITGGTGFIGSHIATEFKKNGYDVLLFKGDITNSEDWEENLKEGVDSIVHAAGIRTESDKDFEINKGGAVILSELLYQKFTIPHSLIYISSQAVYFGKAPPFTEDISVNPKTSYAKSKFESEELLIKAGKDLNIRTVVLRPSTVLGPGVRSGNKMSGPLAIWTENAKLGKPIGINQNGNQTRDYVHVDDVASAVLIAVGNTEIQGIFNVGGGKAIKLIDFAHWVKEALKSKSEIVINGGEATESDPREMFSDTSKLENYGWKTKKTAKEAVFEAVSGNFINKYK